MKAKTVIISLLVTAGAVGGIAYGVRYSMQSRKKPVSVVPVSNVNIGYWNDGDSMYGTIISKDTQTVHLNSDRTLVKVYVKEGDEVKVGDPLLEYDMTMTELKREMEDLTKQTLELNLKSLEKNLEKWKRMSPTASLEIDSGVRTASAEDDVQVTETVSEYAGEGESSSAGNGEQVLEDEDNPAETDPVETNPYEGETGGENNTENHSENPSESGDTILDDDLIEDNDVFSSDGEAASSETLLGYVNDFLTRINQLPQPDEDLKELYGPDVEEALKLFRQNLSVTQTGEEEEDMLGEKRTRTIYSLNPQVAALVGENTANVLQKGYERACVYYLIYCLNQIELGEKTVEELEDAEILALEAQIREAVDADYGIGADALQDYEELLVPYSELLGQLVVRLKNLQVVETEPDTEDFEDETEDEPDYGGYDPGDYGPGDGEYYTAQEIKDAITGLENDIEDCQLDIRETELTLKQYDRELQTKIVKSTMNGVVKSAGTVDDSVADDEFIVITGASGMYVQGNLSELKLDTVSIGDTLQGISYETGMSFTATITEISQYPSNNNDYWYSSENANSSNYPFLAYIEDADGLSEGDVELQIVNDTPSTGIYLENYFIRSESGNKNYVYIQGEDGLLKKQYVVTGVSVYGFATEIKSGLSSQDMIAFPYGKDVVEGAATREVDNLNSEYDYYG